MSLAARLRATARGVALALLTAGFYALWAAGSLLARRSPAARARWRDFNFRHWARAVVALLGVEIETAGRPPRPPFLLVANHLGYLDIVVLASRVDAVFVSRGDVAGWPVVGRLCRAMDTLFVDRGRRSDVPRAVAEIADRLAAGRGVVLFPEGTSSDGAAVGPFRPPLLEAATRCGLGVSYAALAYQTAPPDPPAATAVCWWGKMTFLPHVGRLLGLSGIRARVAFGEQTVREADRKRLARRLRAEVQGLLGRQRVEPEPRPGAVPLEAAGGHR